MSIIRLPNNFKVQEIKKLFKKKIKDRQKIRGVAFSYEEKENPKTFKNKNNDLKDISIKTKIIDQAIVNSFKQYSLFKNYIYSKEQKEKDIIKKDKQKNENLKVLKSDLNYTNLVLLFNIAFSKNNPFTYNINNKLLDLDNTNRGIYKNRVRQILLKKILHDKKIKSRIDTGQNKLGLNYIVQKIENYKNKFKKLKFLNEKKMRINSCTTRGNSNSKINIFKKLNKSNSYITNKTNYQKYNKYLNDTNNSEIKNNINFINNESTSIEPSINTYRVNKELNYDKNEIKVRGLNKCKSEVKINNRLFIKNNTNSNISNNILRNKNNISYIQKKNSYIFKFNKNISIKKSNLRTIINNHNHIKNILKKDIKNTKQKKVTKDIKDKNYANKIEELFKEYKKIKTDSKKLKINYKIWHYSPFKKIEEMVNTKEDMLLHALKQKYFKNIFYSNINDKKRKEKKNIIELIREDFNRIEDEE